MLRQSVRACLWLPFLLLAALPAHTQSIIPAADGTATLVTPDGQRYIIDGGSLSGDGANLFHSFQEFGLSANEIADFLATPGLQNILGRVTGGNASILDGLIQVSGGSPNLYLMNPTGIVFGSNASLNVPASFTATTANRIGFSNGQWFNAIGPNDFSTLIGTPNQFTFTATQPGSLVNAGNLAVPAGHNLMLLGGSVVNTGSLSAPSGNITVAAVPGESLVRVSQDGMLLNLEIQSLAATEEPGLNTGNPSSAPDSSTQNSKLKTQNSLSLPELLTQANAHHATGITVAADGTLRLTGSNLAIPAAPNTTIISGSLDVSASPSSSPSPSSPPSLSSPQPAGSINLLGNQIGLIDARLDASSPNGGGNVRVGGDYQGRGPMATAAQVFVDADSTIRADAVDRGDGGRVILWADDTTYFEGSIMARGGLKGGDGGFVEVSGKENLAFRGGVDVSAPQGQTGSILLDPRDIIIIDAAAGLPDDSQLVPDGAILLFDGGLSTDFTLSNAALTALTGDIFLQADRDIIVEPGADLDFFNQGVGDSITFEAGRNITIDAEIATNGGDLFLQADADFDGDGSVLVSASIFTFGGDISLRGNNLVGDGVRTEAFVTLDSGGGDISLEGNSTFGSGVRLSDFSNLRSQGGRINLTGSSEFGTGISIGFASSIRSGGGDIALVARGGDTAIFNGGDAIASSGGGIELISNGGDIFAGDLDSSGSNGGRIFVEAPANIETGTIDANGDVGQGGSVFLSATGNIQVNWIDSQGTSFGGQIDIFAGRFFRATNSFIARNGVSASISSLGGIQGGSIFIQHGGGSTPFRVGNASQNGTVAAITSGNETISPVQFFTGSQQIGNIEIFNLQGGTGTDLDDFDEDDLSDVDDFDDEGFEDFEDFEFDEFAFGDLTDFELADLIAEELEGEFTDSFEQHLGVKRQKRVTPKDAQQKLQEIEQLTGLRPALVYVFFRPQAPANAEMAAEKEGVLWQFNRSGFTTRQETILPSGRRATAPQATDRLELMLLTAQGKVVRYAVDDATRSAVESTLKSLTIRLSDINRVGSRSYLVAAQQLHDWLIAPMEADLRSQGINSLTFLMDNGLRSLPLAVLHDGERFLLERYSLSLMPSLSLTDLTYTDPRGNRVLAMGASTFPELQPLPSVPVELSAIAGDIWPGTFFLNEQFTLENLKQARREGRYGILHLATHADFRPGKPGNSYIQFWDSKLPLDRLQALNLDNPPVELLVLSACRTALGDEEAELGFAGLAVLAGVKSALGSLWYVSDEGTLALMTGFYEELERVPVKTEALRQAQLAMLRGEIRIKGGQLVALDRQFPLPPDLAKLGDRDLSHPYYWSAFTTIGNPW